MGLGSACTTLAAQAVAYGKATPEGMEWVAVIASAFAAFAFAIVNPKGEQKQ